LQGQFFTGGNVQFNNSNSKTRYGSDLIHNSTNNSLTFSPFAGAFLSEKLALGIELDLALTRNKTGVNDVIISNTTTIGGSPFIRYYAWTWKKFSVFGQGYVGLEFISSRLKQGDSNIDGPKDKRAYAGIYPGVSYNATDKLSLQTSLNFLRMDYSYYTSKDGSSKENTSSFSFGAGLGNIVSVGSLTIGAIYKF
jgi:outer membrane protein